MTAVSLRKAKAIQNALLEEIKSHGIMPAVAVNEFSDIQDQVDAERVRVVSDIDLQIKLYNALYKIRSLVAAVNASSGVNDLLNQLAHREKVLQILSIVTRAGVRKPTNVLNGLVTKATTSDTTYGHSYIDLTTSVFDEDQINDYNSRIKETKRNKQSIQDELLRLNITETITLDEVTVKTLTDVGII